jgi:deazaflavin-dependent oxidoreductase (nitroreductase family)
VARTYRLGAARRLVNILYLGLARRGLAGPHTYVLTVRGRSSGRAYSTPVILVETAEGRWLVAPYGEVSWVRNVRAAGEATLTRAGRRETLQVAEEEPPAAAPVLRHYLAEVRVTRPYFDVAPDDSLEAFAAEAPRHPVFRLLA